MSIEVLIQQYTIALAAQPFIRSYPMTATATETGSKVLEGVFQGVRKAAETNLKMQQEIFQQWSHLFPIPSAQSVWIDKLRDFQKQWTSTVSDMARKHRDVIDKQYQSAVESLDAALRVVEASNPEEYRRRAEQFCRKTLDCMKEISETQIHEFQEAVTKWTELATKVGS
jgi:hypothetical protein